MASPEMVRQVALHTKRFQSSFFYRDQQIEFPANAVMFRARANVTRTEETEARRHSEVVCELAQVLLSNVKPIPFRLGGIASSNPYEAARKARALLGVPADQPIG